MIELRQTAGKEVITEMLDVLDDCDRAQKQIEAARAGIEKEKADAQAGLTAEAGKLATEMIRTVLSPAGGR